MSHAVRENGGVTIVAVEGKLDPDLRAVLERGLPAKNRVVIDLALAKGLKGDDLEVLVSTHHLLDGVGGRLILACVPADLEYILQLMELDEFFHVENSLEDAVKTMAKGGLGARSPTTIQMISFEREKIVGGGSSDKAMDPEKAARRKVERAKLSIRYLAPSEERIALLDFLARTPGTIDAARAAADLGREPAWVDAALAKLAGIRVLVRDESGSFRFSPGPQAKGAIDDILELWAAPANRSKMIEWARGAAQERPSK